MPVEFTGPGLSPAQQSNVSRIRQAEKDEEEKRRRQLLDLELGEVKQRLTPDQYEELLNRQRNFTDIGKVDQSLQWHEISRLASEKGTEDAVNKADELLGKEGKRYLNSIGPRTGPANKQEFDAILNSPDYRRSQRKFNKQAGQAQGREFEYVDRVAGFEDRPTTYAEGLAAGVKAGLYPGGGKFDDHVFDDDVFKRRWADSRRMDKWQLESHTKALKGEINAFEETRQKLTENFQRMDPFARTQYKEMEKKAKGLERARQEGRLRPLEYLRHMSQLADAAKTIKWNFHMKAPGGEVGDIWDKDGDGAFYQRQPDGTVKMVKMSPEYFQSKTQKLDDGLWLIPTIDKDGREVMKEVKGGRPTTDWKEKQEYTAKLEKLEDEYMKQALSDDPEQDPEEAREWAQQMAIKRLGDYKRAADQFANPDQDNPDADPESFLQARSEAQKQAAYEEAQLAMKQRAMKQFAQRKRERQQLVDAVQKPTEVATRRRKDYMDIANAIADDNHNKLMEQWNQNAEAILTKWEQETGGMGDMPELPPKPKRGKPQPPEKAFKKEYRQMLKDADGDPELFGHLFHMLANENPQLRHLLDNPIPLDKRKLQGSKGSTDYLRDGYVYAMRGPTGSMVRLLKYKGRLLKVRNEMPQPDLDQEAKGFAGQFTTTPGNVLQDAAEFYGVDDEVKAVTDRVRSLMPKKTQGHGNPAADQAAGGNL